MSLILQGGTWHIHKREDTVPCNGIRPKIETGKTEKMREIYKFKIICQIVKNVSETTNIPISNISLPCFSPLHWWMVKIVYIHPWTCCLLYKHG